MGGDDGQKEVEEGEREGEERVGQRKDRGKEDSS